MESLYLTDLLCIFEMRDYEGGLCSDGRHGLNCWFEMLESTLHCLISYGSLSFFLTHKQHSVYDGRTLLPINKRPIH